MISLSISDFFNAALCGGLIFIAILAIRMQGRIKQHSWSLTSRHLFKCDHCHLSFVPKDPVTLCRCPRCNAYCVKKRRVER